MHNTKKRDIGSVIHFRNGYYTYLYKSYILSSKGELSLHSLDPQCISKRLNVRCQTFLFAQSAFKLYVSVYVCPQGILCASCSTS